MNGQTKDDIQTGERCEIEGCNELSITEPNEPWALCAKHLKDVPKPQKPEGEQ